jgi:hypothetical protein
LIVAAYIKTQNKKFNHNNITDDPISFPIHRKHKQNFATAAASDAFGRSWVAPEDRDFTDRLPPIEAVAAKPE